MTPRISILLPVFDAADTLEPCLRSVLRQRETRFECVIVDDGSRDASAEIARRLAARDARFRVIERAHEGLVASLNAGIDACRAPFVARMDADDWMHRDRLALQLALLETRPELALVGCHVRMFPRTPEYAGRLDYARWLSGMRSPEQIRADAFVECPIAHPTWLIRRELLTRLRYRDCGWPEDYDLLLRLLGEGREVGVVPRRLLGWRDHEARLSRTSPTYAQHSFTACKAAHLATGLLAARHDYILWGYGDTGRALCRALREHDKRPAQIVELHPGRIGQRIQGATVIAPEALSHAPRLPIVASVAGPDARAKIRAFLEAMGRADGRDFVCAA